mmetsp:Transcript_6901/g.13219  ORF Transcript_6901/g.13219 Transcript_6901/m.13219 type:complete len:117 (-) Transcript_6901:53-403(-)
MEFTITIAFTLKSSESLNAIDDKLNDLQEKASNVDGFKDYEIFLDIGTSIFQERWQTVENFLTHFATVRTQYLSFLNDVVVCKLDITGTEAAIANSAMKDIFASFRPKYTTLDIEQ